MHFDTPETSSIYITLAITVNKREKLVFSNKNNKREIIDQNSHDIVNKFHVYVGIVCRLWKIIFV